MDFGLPGLDAGKGGKHLILPSDYDGGLPSGYYAGADFAVWGHPGRTGLSGATSLASDSLARPQHHDLQEVQ